MRCEHVAVVHDGVDDLSLRLAPHLRRASAEGAAVLICLDELAAARVRSDIGVAADSFIFTPAVARYSNPGISMAALEKFLVDAMSSGASTAWSIGSIPFAGDSRDTRWVRYEEAVNDIFADRPLRAVCLYDAIATPLELRHSVASTHHAVDGRWTGETKDLTVSYDLLPLRLPDCVLVNPSPSNVRAAFGTLLGDSIDVDVRNDIRLVGSELTSNAITHGSLPYTVKIWMEGAFVVLQVRDSGAAGLDPYADLRPFAGGAHGGFGLWTVGQLADAVHISTDGHSTTVTAAIPTFL